MSTFQKATKTKSKLRLALFGPSGAGKTYTSLALAKGIGGSIALIDTEYGTAAKYADRFDFEIARINEPTIDQMVALMQDATGFDVLIIDSLTHAWQELLQEVDMLARAKYGGNSWSAWSEGTPKQKKLVKAILQFPGHLIATMRSKTEWTTTEGKNGKKTPQRVGLAPEQGKGIEYEFDMLMEVSTEHTVNVIKDRTGKFQDQLIDRPGPEFGADIAAWLNEGEPTVDDLVAEIQGTMSDWTDEEKEPFRIMAKNAKKTDIPAWKMIRDAALKAKSERLRNLMAEELPAPEQEPPQAPDDTAQVPVAEGQFPEEMF